MSGGVGRRNPREMFERLDLVKFTDHVPVTIEGAELLEEAKNSCSRREGPISHDDANGPMKVAEHASS